MRILFVHQNFPAQFKHLAPELIKHGHDVRAIAFHKNPIPKGVEMYYYAIHRRNAPNIHPWLTDTESKIIRGEAVFKLALDLRNQGYFPNVIIAHPGWGESLFLNDVWPDSALGIYAEFYYQTTSSDCDFDPEFSVNALNSPCRIRVKNINHDLQLQSADAAISPTHFQKSTFPPVWHDKISVIHDGIDTDFVKPNASAYLMLNDGIRLSKNDEIITFVNRNLEPMRGYHSFMRCIPMLLEKRPSARVIIVGGDDVSYGAKPPKGQRWKDIFLDEVKDKIDSSRVHFVGKISYPYFITLLQISSVHVYLTYPFVLSWSLLEAMSAGCAIVASNTAPVREVIQHNTHGMLVDFFDYQALADSIACLLDNPLERARLGAAARLHVQENYDLKTKCLPAQLAWIDEFKNPKTP